MPNSGSSSVQAARQVLADRLREIARDAGLTGRDLARACRWHPAKVSRISNAKTSPSAEDIRAWCRVCGAEDQVDDLIASLRAVEGMFVEWRRMERSGLRHAQQAVLPLYERTRTFRVYSPGMLPGLIQTRAYTTAVLRATQRRRVQVDDVDAAVEVRMQRQHVLFEPGRTFSFLIEESALLSGLAGPEVAVEQLRHLVDVASLANTSLGIIPASTTRSSMPVEDFWIFDNVQANVELVSGYLTITQPREVAAYVSRFRELSSDAVYGASARALITSAMLTFG